MDKPFCIIECTLGEVSMARRLASEFSTSVMKNDMLSFCGESRDSTVTRVWCWPYFSGVSSWPHDHFYRPVRTQGHRRLGTDVLARNQFEFPAHGQRSKNQQHLLPGESFADAVAVASTEREIGAARQLILEAILPALGLEMLRIHVETSVPVHDVLAHD